MRLRFGDFVNDAVTDDVDAAIYAATADAFGEFANSINENYVGEFGVLVGVISTDYVGNPEETVLGDCNWEGIWNINVNIDRYKRTMKTKESLIDEVANTVVKQSIVDAVEAATESAADLAIGEATKYADRDIVWNSVRDVPDEYDGQLWLGSRLLLPLLQMN